MLSLEDCPDFQTEPIKALLKKGNVEFLFLDRRFWHLTQPLESVFQLYKQNQRQYQKLQKISSHLPLLETKESHAWRLVTGLASLQSACTFVDIYRGFNLAGFSTERTEEGLRLHWDIEVVVAALHDNQWIVLEVIGEEQEKEEDEKAGEEEEEGEEEAARLRAGEEENEGKVGRPNSTDKKENPAKRVKLEEKELC